MPRSLPTVIPARIAVAERIANAAAPEATTTLRATTESIAAFLSEAAWEISVSTLRVGYRLQEIGDAAVRATGGQNPGVRVYRPGRFGDVRTHARRLLCLAATVATVLTACGSPVQTVAQTPWPPHAGLGP